MKRGQMRSEVCEVASSEGPTVPRERKEARGELEKNFR